MSAVIAAWSVNYLLHSTLLIGTVWLAARWIRSASARDTLWKVALLGGLLTASLQTFAPAETVVPAAAPPRITFDRAALARVVPAIAPRESVPALPESSVWRPQPEALVLGAWAAIALLLLTRIAIGHRRFLRTLGRRLEIVLGPERERLDRLCAGAGLARTVRLTESTSLASPVAMLGFEIVIPTTLWGRLSDAQKETILAHELGHLLRRDPLWLLLTEIVKAVLFFQPLHGVVRAKMKETAEFLCDDAAVLHTGHRKELAETLAELATQPLPRRPPVAAMAEGGSNLVARVTRVLRSTPAKPLRLHWRVALALLVLGTLAAFAPGMLVGAVRAGTRVKGTGFYATTVNSFTDANLEQTFPGPEGKTSVRFDAHEVAITLDGSSVRLLEKNGFLRATQTAEHGPKREVAITAGRDGEPVYLYRVDGVETPWCDDARRVAIAGFRSEDAYADVPATSRGGRSLTDPHDWRATIELTGTEDGVPTYLSILAHQVRVDYATGDVDLGRGARIEVLERHGEEERRFRMDPRGKTYEGDFDGLEKAAWLERLLDRQTDLPDNVIETIAR